MSIAEVTIVVSLLIAAAANLVSLMLNLQTERMLRELREAQRKESSRCP